MATNQSPINEGLTKLEEQITCSICFEHFNNPKVLPCFHSFCLHCLKNVPVVLVDGSHSLPCPTCRSHCPVPDEGLASLPSSFVINSLMDAYELMKKVSDHQHTHCDNCSNTNANHYCKQCARFLCQQCLHHHNNWRPNCGHETISLDEVEKFTIDQPPFIKREQSMVCSKHDEPLKMFCETCQELICRDCTLTTHKGHGSDFISETYDQHKDIIIQSSFKPLNREFHRLTEAKKILCKRTNEISQQATSIKEEIQHNFNQIKKHVEEMEKQLVADVELAAECKLSVLDQQLKEINEALGLVVQCRDHVDQCVKIGTPQEVLLTKSQIMNHSQNVINSLDNKTFTPLERPDIKLVKNDLIEYNNIGSIKCTFHPLKAYLSRCHIPLFGKESTVRISFLLPDGSPAPVPLSFIKCHLTPPDNTSPPIQCIVNESLHSRQYNIVFTPITEGLHQLHITINNCSIPGSPLNVPVPDMMRTPIKTVTEFFKPSGIAVTDDGKVILSESDRHHITILDYEGKKIRSFGTEGNKKGQLKYPGGVVVTLKGTILVSDSNNHRIQEFTMDGNCISSVGTYGDGRLQFNCPLGITINRATGQVFIADLQNNRIQVLYPDLTFSHFVSTDNTEEGKSCKPHDVTIDSRGFMYVTNCIDNCIHKFSPEGHFISSFGAKGSKKDQLYCPSGIIVDHDDLLYINNDHNQYITVYTTDGQYISSIYKEGKNDSTNVWFSGMTFDSKGNLFVCFPLGNVFWLF